MKLSLTARLGETVLLRPPGALAARRLVMAAGGALLVFVGMIRFSRGPDFCESIFAGFLPMIPRLRRIFWSKPESCVGAEYLAWLNAATKTLRSNLKQQRAPRAADIRLAVAINGPAALPWYIDCDFPRAALASFTSPPGDCYNDIGEGVTGGE